MKSFSKVLKLSNCGFSLIEVVGAILIFSVVGILFSQLGTSASIAFNDLEKRQHISDSIDLLKLNLKNNRACKANFQQAPAVGLNQEIPFGFHAYNTESDTLMPDSFLAVGMEYRGVTVKKMEVLERAPLAEATHMAELRVTYSMKLGNVYQEYIRFVPLVAVVKSGVITDCWLKKDNRTIFMSQVCSAISNGALNAVDTSTGECVLAGGKWYTGSVNNASCPDGIVPEDANSDYNCRVQVAPGFTDPFPPVQIPMTGGTVATQQRSSYMKILNRAKKECICDWATDLAPSTYSSSKCQIYCVAP